MTTPLQPERADGSGDSSASLAFLLRNCRGPCLVRGLANFQVDDFGVEMLTVDGNSLTTLLVPPSTNIEVYNGIKTGEDGRLCDASPHPPVSLKFRLHRVATSEHLGLELDPPSPPDAHSATPSGAHACRRCRSHLSE